MKQNEGQEPTISSGQGHGQPACRSSILGGYGATHGQGGTVAIPCPEHAAATHPYSGIVLLEQHGASTALIVSFPIWCAMTASKP